MKKTLSLAVALFLILGFSEWTAGQPGRKGRAYPSRTAGEVVTLKGEITNVLKPFATFKSEGKEYKVHLGPVWYWNQEKFELGKGQAEIIGEYEEIDGELRFYPNKIVQGKVEIVLVSDDGWPRWADKGFRRDFRGHGRYHHHRCGGCGRW